MRTIFITVFEGVEAKNILRTPILSTLLLDDHVRLVLFMKSDERVEYYRKEFSHPRIMYEVVKRRPLRGFDKFLASFKFTMLRTETTISKRKLLFEENGRRLSYLWDTGLNWFFSQKIFLRIFHAVDSLFVRNNFYEKYFDRYMPETVFLAHLFDEMEIDLLREAKRRGVRTVGIINSWDKVTSRSIIRQEPDHFIVFNEMVRNELMHYGNVKKERIFVSGVPQYDFYFHGAAASREEFFSRIGVSPLKKLILYAPLGNSFSNSDREMMDFFHDLVEEGTFGGDIQLLVRFQPNDFINNVDLQKRPWLVYDYPGTRFSSTRGVDLDMDTMALANLKDTLTHISLLICFASSLSVDAAIFDKPIINIGFEMQSQKPTMRATQYFEREHYKKALATGGIRLVRSKAELIEWVRAYLNDPALDHQGRKRLVREQCSFTDGKSGERIGRYLLNQGSQA